jgi:hypothetical protein
MIDFKSLVGPAGGVQPYDLERLYESLDVKSTHTELRTAQKEAMAVLTAKHAERDLVLKINTGAGKTTIGLLYLLGHMKQARRPGVFLCSTTQLVEQVIQEADRLGVSAFAYPAGETHANPACLRGDAVLVCTYEKLFNAKSTFVRTNIVPVAIVLDDAHAGAELVRKQFTLKLAGPAFGELLRRLKAPCSTYHPTKWRDIELFDPHALLEVPHWIWSEAVPDVRLALHKYADDEGFRFVWPFLESNLELCRCVLSGIQGEIAPEILPVHLLRPYSSADHRLFMSATLADDSLLVRELGVKPDAAKSPIVPPSDRGVGERMIMAPALVEPDLDRASSIQLCAELARSNNVVVLTSSELLARDWVNAGARYFSADRFAEGVRALKDPSSGLRFAVFAQRYDGVDLPDDSCRVLVLDGIPFGEGLIDKVDSAMVFSPGGVRNRTVFRVEQGMGRAVRSHADYAVVLLVGQELATYVGRSDVLQSMTGDTRAQLELSVELAELMKKSSSADPEAVVRQVVHQCLGRDQGWKDFYNQRIRSTARRVLSPRVDRIDLANDERDSYLLAMANAAIDAVPRLRKAINDAKLSAEEEGIYLQRLSRIAYSIDPPDALRIQQAARERCTTVSIPPAAPRKPPAPGSKTVAEKFCEWFRQFSPANAGVLEADRICGSMSFDAAPHSLEQALLKLGQALGADSSRPEVDYSDGPDNLWFWGDNLYVIEVKNENKISLHKKDSGQLHNSIAWAKSSFPAYADRVVPVTAAKIANVDDDAHYPEGTRVLLEDGAKRLARGMHQLCVKLASEGPIFLTPANVWNQMQELQLLPEQFVNRYTAPTKK